MSIDLPGNQTSWSFNVFDRPMNKTDAPGNVWTSLFDILGWLVGRVGPSEQETADSLYNIAPQCLQQAVQSLAKEP